MGGGYPCGCCKCKLCSTGLDGVMHVTAEATNDECTSTPGCAIIDDLYVMTRVKGGPLDWVYEPDYLVFGTKGCKWMFTFPGVIECSTATCDACDCSLNHPKEFFECDPMDVNPCNDPFNPSIIVPSPSCTTCEEDGQCTTLCEAEPTTYDPEYCGCIADGTSGTGYRCFCDGDCDCEADCNSSGLIVRVWLYPVDDGMGAIDPDHVGLHVEVFFDTCYYTHDAELAAVDGKVDCGTVFTNYVASLTAETTHPGSGPGSVVLCDPLTEITLDLV
jgi:hypothetical protein